MSNEQLAAGAASDLNNELDVEDGMMCVFVDNTEISHYLMSHNCKVCVCCKTAYKNGTDNAEIIEKMGVCENCITDI